MQHSHYKVSVRRNRAFSAPAANAALPQPKPRRVRIGCVAAVLLLLVAACSGDSETALAPTAVPQATIDVPPADDDGTEEAVAAPSEQEAPFEACAFEQGLPVPIATDIGDLAARWDAAVAAVAPGELTPFDTTTLYSVTDQDGSADAAANYVGDRAFLVGMSRSEGVDAVSLYLAPESPVIASAVRAFILMILGPDAPNAAANEVTSAVTLWRPDSVLSQGVVHNCYWQASRQPLSIDEDDVILTLSVSAAETTDYANGDFGEWLRREGKRASTALFVTDARRWDGQQGSG